MWRPALLLLLLTQGAAALVTRGASPEVASLLSRLSTFACDGGSRRLPLQRFNDDYCDCQDGTDEPGAPHSPAAHSASQAL
jgi:protein kinase C substrate 80K-H